MRMRADTVRGVAGFMALALVVMVGLLMVFAASACAPDDGVQVPGNTARVRRYIDGEAGVVCWVSTAGCGIDCMPVGDTWLSVMRP